MSRTRRLFIQGIPHLVALRGHNYSPLFQAPEDYHQFLNDLDVALAQFEVSLYAYSLASEHILLLLESSSKERLGRFMQSLGRHYVPWYNQRYGRRGTLWDNRFLASPVEPDSHFLLVKKFVERSNQEKDGYHSFADTPTERITAHAVWLASGATADCRKRNYQQLYQQPVNVALTNRIRFALEQNCPIATLRFTETMEQQLGRPLRPRQCGRPRKHERSKVEEWAWLEKQAGRILQRYSYNEVRLPLLDEWEKTLDDPPFSHENNPVALNNQALLAGDGTRGCLRLLAQNAGLPANCKLWYQGTLFRRPNQSARLQLSSQLGVEAFGYSGVAIELEQLILQYRFFQFLKLDDYAELRINNPGSPEEYHQFRRALLNYYHPIRHLLTAAQSELLDTQPELLLTDQDSLLQRLATTAPSLTHFLSASSKARFEHLGNGLNCMGIPWIHDTNMYPTNDYCHLVAEWHSDRSAYTGLLCRGGRYDGCASRVTGQPTFACGFAFMLEPIMHLLHEVRRPTLPARKVDVILIPTQSHAHSLTLHIADQIRQGYPDLSIASDFSALKTATRQKNACRQGARFIVTVDDELQHVVLDDLEKQRQQQLSPQALLMALGSATIL
ncbi:histidyl-tRNA synthetase [Izhakiella capsodis]|uniref:Histidyl-tRNA synthetase n=1 Tax=Izhakiella capsodis TaxID=1367852 RepID=A0A1I4YYF5_9GAMM|nr:ATP phosphoribosyltransferase regulatory subunit [Izhakiella capsodis]SFN43032.1 histidyl-tRNA synthetase [Izhakiella capsodis]